MTKGRSKSDTPGAVLMWGGDLTVRRIGELREELQQSLGKSCHVIIRFDAAEEIDIAVLQLLCATHRAAARDGKAVEIAGPLPEAISKTARMAGFSRHTCCYPDKMEGCLWTDLLENRQLGL